MMTTNKLTKTFASGFATISIATVAGIVNAPSASAQSVVCYTGSRSALIGQTVSCGDKDFSNFSFTGFTSAPDVVTIEEDVLPSGISEWSFGYDPVPNLTAGTYSLSYDVNITDPGFVFDLVQLGTETGIFPGVEVTKTVENLLTGQTVDLKVTGNDSVLGSINGWTHIRVKDDIVITGNGLLESFSNDFTQKTVPEPGTILGLMAVGGLGLVSRFKKQK
jgi:hypothetical protein